MKLLEKFKAARRASVPLVVIQTPDPQATMKAILAEHKAKPVLQWDAVRGIKAWTQQANKMLAAMVNAGVDAETGALSADAAEQIEQKTLSPVESLVFANDFKPESILFYLNAHRYLDNATVAQAVWNLRDAYKGDKRTLVLLAPQITLPAELKNDVIILDEPLPTDKDLEKIIVDTYEAAGLDVPDSGVLQRAVDAIAGIPAFPAENSAAMALTKKGLDMDMLGAQKRQQVAGIPGASIWSGKENWGDVVGCRNIVSFLDKLCSNGKERIREIFFLDELEKMQAGTGDTSGVSQAMNEQFLAWSQNSRALGLILLGVPGAGKSLISKAVAGQFQLPCFTASLSKVKGSLVGESERNAAALFKAADAIAGGGRILMVATCNNLAALTPEMQARFRLGTYFFDYPDEEQRAGLWAHYRKKFGIADAKVPESTNWVGREIESACELSYLLDSPLAEAAKRIVPVCNAKAAEMEQLKLNCSGRFVSADYDGIFQYKKSSGGATLSDKQPARALLDS